VVSQPLLKNTTEPVEEQVVCASSRSGPRHLGSRSPTDSSNIPGFGPQWQMIRPVEQVAQSIKKGRKLLVSLPCILLYGLHLTYVFPYPQTGEYPQYANIGNQEY
jgi:hypothetical protein